MYERVFGVECVSGVVVLCERDGCVSECVSGWCEREVCMRVFV